MIISRTPLRVSLCGGGTDIPTYYRASAQGGAVTSVSLGQYIHVVVNERFEDDIRVSYSQTEIVDDFEELEHELVREAMRMTGVTQKVEISTIADIPSRGTGLGSSSAVTVGLLTALHAHAGRQVDPLTIAAQACQIEIDILGQPIGRQDQYGCALGGVNHIVFNRDDSVEVATVDLDESTIARFAEEFTLLYTGLTRSASDVLSRQGEATASKMADLDRMVDQSREVRDALLAGDFDAVGRLLHEGWMIKRGLADGISMPEIDRLYDIITGCGATGGKLLGAGGGGFILFHGTPAVRQAVADALPEHRLVPLETALEPSRIIFHE